MDWSETLFQKSWEWLVRAGQSKRNQEKPEAIYLAPIKGRLTQLARILTGDPIDVMTAEIEGGYLHNTFFLPAQMNHYSEPKANLNFYLFRVAFLSIQRELGLNWSEPGQNELIDSRSRSAESAEQVLTRLKQSYPGSIKLLQSLQIDSAFDLPLEEQALFWGHWMTPPSDDGNRSSKIPNHHEQGQGKPKTTREAPAREDVEVLEIDKTSIKEYTLQHYFEKVETLESFHGNWRETDGDDDLADHENALQEVDLRQVVRSDDPVHSVYQAEFLLNTTTPESSETQFSEYFLTYDEWNGKKKIYRRDYCRIYPKTFNKNLSSYYLNTLKKERQVLMQLRVRFSQFLNELEQVRRQRDGESLDIDALIENYTDRKAGCPPSERIFLSRRKKQRDIAVLILVDLSLSTDAYTDGQRVIDVEKKAVILFSEILSEYGDQFQIDGFSSRTRNHCDYLTIKSFKESWKTGANRIGALEPRGYTRIGPALRHATHQLKNIKASKKWILLLSDGKPNDYDRYEGQYGIQDVRQAIREAKSDKIETFALAVERVAKNYLPLMLGEGGFQILPHPQQLAQALTHFYSRLIQS